jgi:hypothetical protein
MSLLFLAICAVTAIEAAARFWQAHLTTGKSGFQDAGGWLMLILSLACLVFYFRTRKLRKKSLKDKIG